MSFEITEGISQTSVICEWKKNKNSVQPAAIRLINARRPGKHQLPKETAQEPLKCRNYPTKNPLLSTGPLTNDKLEKLHLENLVSTTLTSAVLFS